MAALTFKVKRFNWGGDCCEIINIPTAEFMALGGQIYKYLLESDGDFIHLILKDYVGTYVEILSCESQDDTMLFESIIDSLFSEGKCKVYSQSKEFHTLGEESGVLLIEKA